MAKAKKKKYSLLVKTRPKEMKAWQDCQWLRVPCNQDSCLICGRIRRDQTRHIKKGEDPDTMEAAIEDMGNTFKETLELLHKDAKKMGIDLDNLEEVEEPKRPEPQEFPLYNEVRDWRKGIYEIVEASDDVSSAWLYSEAGEDLLWYVNTLLAKIFRQLSTVREMTEEEEEYMELEYGYTGYVLAKVLDILGQALIALSQSDYPQAKQFDLARLNFDAIKQKIINF